VNDGHLFFPIISPGQAASERCAAILQAQSSETIGRSTTDRQASFGAPIFAYIRSLPGQQTEVLEKDIDFRSSLTAM
jgi:hypothetical protein